MMSFEGKQRFLRGMALSAYRAGDRAGVVKALAQVWGMLGYLKSDTPEEQFDEVDSMLDTWPTIDAVIAALTPKLH